MQNNYRKEIENAIENYKSDRKTEDLERLKKQLKIVNLFGTIEYMKENRIQR